MISDAEKQQIQGAIDREYARSLSKWGNWDDILTYTMMWDVVNAELEEVDASIYREDHHGEHGTFNELAQVAACAMKMMVQILRREHEPDQKA
jgi:hypothetical protein